MLQQQKSSKQRALCPCGSRGSNTSAWFFQWGLVGSANSLRPQEKSRSFLRIVLLVVFTFEQFTTITYILRIVMIIQGWKLGCKMFLHIRHSSEIGIANQKLVIPRKFGMASFTPLLDIVILLIGISVATKSCLDWCNNVGRQARPIGRQSTYAERQASYLQIGLIQIKSVRECLSLRV